MARESKQDRIVRLMFDQMTEHFIELRNLEANPNCKELEIERWAQSTLKTCLGYSATNGYSIRAQEQKGKYRPDLIVYKNEQPIFVMEVKNLKFDLEKSDFRSGKIQLSEYLYQLGKVPYGILCNGYQWRLYDFTDSNCVTEIASIDLRSDDEEKIDNSKKTVEEKCYDFISFHENSFSSKEWPELLKEATAFSPESLTKAILSANVVRQITKEIRGEHEYKASLDSLYDKVFNLLTHGLNDLINDHEVKEPEFKKYIKSQLKISRKTKKVAKKTDDGEVPQIQVQDSTEVILNANTSNEKVAS